MVVVAEQVAQEAVEDHPPVPYGLAQLLSVRGRLSVQLPKKLARSHAVDHFHLGIARDYSGQWMDHLPELPPDQVVWAVLVVDVRRLSP